jgi:shikimate 5-dehydrogenase
VNTWDKNFSVKVESVGLARDVCATADVIINCTSVGMEPDYTSSPLPVQYINPNQILIDTIYAPLRTQLLKFGAMKNAHVINGLDMFITQGIASLEYWTGETIYDQVNFGAVKRLLEAAV